KQLRNAKMKKRMIANVPKAAVVITNPTHYAVALQYERGMAAPICVAKGVDALAMRIREVAGEHRIPIVENPPLARALHATVEIDQPIPSEHYKAVAEVIGYVLRLRRAAGRLDRHRNKRSSGQAHAATGGLLRTWRAAPFDSMNRSSQPKSDAATNRSAGMAQF